jgi:hypothetical protein
MECRAYGICLDSQSRGYFGKDRKVSSAAGGNLSRMHKTEETAKESRLNVMYSHLRNRTLVTNVRTSGPYKQAEELRYHPFNHAAQFTTQKPFMLIFSYLYRFNAFLRDDRPGLTEKFFRSLARRAFIQLSSDTQPGSQYDSKMPNGVTVGDASALLSAILFVDLGTERYHVFFNPRAKHPIPQGIESS